MDLDALRARAEELRAHPEHWAADVANIALELDGAEPVDGATVRALVLQFVAWIDDLTMALAETRVASKAPDGASAGSRFLDRAMGPDLAETLDVLTATEHALELERGMTRTLALELERFVGALAETVYLDSRLTASRIARYNAMIEGSKALIARAGLTVREREVLVAIAGGGIPNPEASS